jgi:periplasmic protein TonB
MMTGEARTHRQTHLRLALLDEPWQRFPLVVVVATLFWCLILVGLGLLLQPDRTNVPHPAPVDAEIIEVPPHGLAGGGGGSPAAGGDFSTPPKSPQPSAVNPSRQRSLAARASAIPPPRQEPIAAPDPKTTETHIPVAPVNPAPRGSQLSSALTPTGGNGATGNGVGGQGGVGRGIGTGVGNGVGPGTGTGSAGGFGSGGTGPTAIYAPAPTIPDDMREDVLEAVAVAHFRVLRDGRVIVSLAKPTDFSRLNDVILDTLREWRFRPAMNQGGVAVDSEAEVRLLIKVQ